MTTELLGFKDIVDSYDMFIFDIWGVVHNGYKHYPHVVETLRFLNQNKKVVCFLSNSPKKGVNIQRDLDKFGVSEDLYSFVYTAGDSFWNSFYTVYKKTTQNAWFVVDDANTVSRDIFVDHGMNLVDELSLANNVVVASVNEQDFGLDKYKDFIVTCIKNNINVYSMNADAHVVSKNGPLMRPAQLMFALDSVGVNTIQHGKPSVSIFNELFSLVPGVPKNKCLMVGDSFSTDVTGAKAAGIDSVLVYNSYPVESAVFHYSEGKVSLSGSDKSLAALDVLKLISGRPQQPEYYISEVKV